MAKTQHSIILTAYARVDGEVIPARSEHFVEDNKAVILNAYSDKTGTTRVILSADLQTATLKRKGEYTLKKHATQNKYLGTCKGVKVHFVPGKLSGKLIYWAETPKKKAAVTPTVKAKKPVVKKVKAEVADVHHGHERTCPKCNGTGLFKTGGNCFMCAGKGYLTHADDKRNAYYWKLRKKA